MHLHWALHAVQLVFLVLPARALRSRADLIASFTVKQSQARGGALSYVARSAEKT